MGKKILLADDSITIQKVIELTFSDEDFEVVTVGNGRLAVEKLDEVRPDIVLCDIIMPEKDGYEVCDHIKKHPSLGNVPVLLLTGAFEPFDQERAARVGCDGFLAKPFEPQALISKVKDLLSQAASRPQTTPPMPVPEAVRAVAPPPPAPEPPPPPVFAEPPAPPPVAEALTMPSTPAPPMAFLPDDEPQFEPLAEPEPAPVEPAFEPAVGSYHQPMDLMPEPDTPLPPYVPPPPPPVAIAEDFGSEEPVVASADEFMPLMAEEAESLQAPPAPEPPPAPVPPVAAPSQDDGASTVVFHSGQAPAWSSPTIEVPLEMRAQASAAAAAEAARPVFEEPAPVPTLEVPAPEFPDEPVFEPDFGEPAAVAAPEPEPPAPIAAPVAAPVAPEPPPPPPPAPFVPPPFVPPPAAPEAVASFADLRAEEPPPAEPPSSHAAEVAVPMEQVAQIAQRVVAQISEKVVREVAWEVIPDLAEALIKKEIERLRAELDKA